MGTLLRGVWGRQVGPMTRECPACKADVPRFNAYRCPECGHDLAGSGNTAGREQ